MSLRCGGVLQGVERLPCKYEVLNSNPSTAKINKKKKNENTKENITKKV
jgi:hypothetical protein